MRCIIAQQLVPRADGKGLMAVREYLKFDQSVRNELYSLNTMTLLTERIQSIVHERELSFAHFAKKLLSEGKISEYYANRLILSAGVL